MEIQIFPKMYLKEQEYFNSQIYRLNEDVELSGLIDSLTRSLTYTYKQEMDLNQDKFIDIIDFLVKKLKFEYKRTKELDIKEFLIWHWSSFMLLQTFIEIIESKYLLEEIEKIKEIYSNLWMIDFYIFLKENSSQFGKEDITNKLYSLRLYDNISVLYKQNLEGKKEKIMERCCSFPNGSLNITIKK